MSRVKCRQVHLITEKLWTEFQSLHWTITDNATRYCWTPETCSKYVSLDQAMVFDITRHFIRDTYLDETRNNVRTRSLFGCQTPREFTMKLLMYLRRVGKALTIVCYDLCQAVEPGDLRPHVWNTFHLRHAGSLEAAISRGRRVASDKPLTSRIRVTVVDGASIIIALLPFKGNTSRRARWLKRQSGYIAFPL